jgi:flagellar hook-associated protein 3 FlgL
MRVTFNTFPDTLLARLQALGSEQNKALVQLSTGQRIAAPSDDPAAMQRILNLRTDKKQEQQYYRNAQGGLDINQATFSTLDELSQLLTRSSELAANVSGATSSQDFQAKYAEVTQLIEQGLNTANSQLRGSYLLAGDASGSPTPPFAATRDANGVLTGVTYVGSNTVAEMNIAETATLSVYATADENKDVAGMLNKLIELRYAIKANDSGAVLAKQQELIDDTGNYEDKLLASMSRAGSIQYRLETTMKDLEVRFDSTEELISIDADVDFAEATVRLSRAQLAYQAAIQSGAKIESNSLLDYLR